MHRPDDAGVHRASRRALIASALLMALAVAACGENDPGDPVPVARELATPMPSGGLVDVSCVPSVPITTDDRPEECSIDLKVADTTSMADAEAWLIAVGQRLGPSVGRIFRFDGRQFFWNAIHMQRREDATSLEYVCGGGVRPIYYAPRAPVAPGAVPPLPATSSWFTSIDDARAAGCRLAVAAPSP